MLEQRSVSKRRLELLISFVFLLGFWMLISLPSDPHSRLGLLNVLENALVGIPLAALITWLLPQPVFTHQELILFRPLNFLRLLFYLLYLGGQIIKGGTDVASRVLRPTLKISPVVTRFHTPVHDELAIAIIANSITLTPGTITLDAVKDEQGSTFLVHCISHQELEEIKKGHIVTKISRIFGMNDAT